MGVGYIAPFDFYKIFVDTFLGNIELFFVAFVILFSFVAAKFRMSNKIFMVLIGIGAIIFSSIIGNAVYLLVIVVVGLIIFKGIGRIVY